MFCSKVHVVLIVTVEDFTLNDVKPEISPLMLTRFSKMDQENVQHFVLPCREAKIHSTQK